MISFVWSSKYPFTAGSGGSENYTAGHIRELQRRGIPCRILTLGFGEQDGRQDFPDITFKALSSEDELAELDDIIVFVTYPLDVKTKHKSYVILHCSPITLGAPDPLFNLRAMAGKQLIAPSRFSAKLWRQYLPQAIFSIPVVHPFADEQFGLVKRPQLAGPENRILFAGRLSPNKGIYTLLASLHMPGMKNLDYSLTVTDAGSRTEAGQIVHQLLEHHPLLNLVPACKTPSEMAWLMAEHDVVVMPSSDIFYTEAFGIVSVEAQHAGCRVVASRTGGLPETSCGNLILVDPDNPQALANGVALASALGPVTASERIRAAAKFTVGASLDKLLSIILSDMAKETVQKRLKTVPLVAARSLVSGA